MSHCDEQSILVCIGPIRTMIRYDFMFIKRLLWCLYYDTIKKNGLLCIWLFETCIAFVTPWQGNNIWRKQWHNFVLTCWNGDKWSDMCWQHPSVLPDMFYTFGKKLNGKYISHLITSQKSGKLFHFASLSFCIHYMTWKCLLGYHFKGST